MAMNTNEFFIMSYLKEDELTSVLQDKIAQIDKYAYIFHDKDVYEEDTTNGSGFHSKGELKEPHFHLYLKLGSYRMRDEIYRWFNNDKFKANTRLEEVRSTTSVLKYLTHESDLAIMQGKYVYSADSIVKYNIDFNEYNYTVDTTSMILQDILNGFSVHTLTVKYGREFVYHVRDFNFILKTATGLDFAGYQQLIMNATDKQKYSELIQSQHEAIDLNNNIILKKEKN